MQWCREKSLPPGRCAYHFNCENIHFALLSSCQVTVTMVSKNGGIRAALLGFFSSGICLKNMPL